MSADRTLLKWNPDISATTLVTWVIMIGGAVVMWTNTQRDIDQLKIEMERNSAKIEMLDDAFSEVKADIRVIRQILENGGRVAK